MVDTVPDQAHAPIHGAAAASRGTRHPVRVVTAASLFDGHDASINIMRRILQSRGAEVVHLGHDGVWTTSCVPPCMRTFQAVAVSSYQGGHVEYFSYLIDRLREVGRSDVKVFGGWWRRDRRCGDRRAARPWRDADLLAEDGQRLGLTGMIDMIIEACDSPPERDGTIDVDALAAGDERALARAISVLEAGVASAADRAAIEEAATARRVPVLGLTGTGGSGKSSLTDELVRRFRLDQDDRLRIAVLAVDPTRRRGGGALLGDRIRMNTLDGDRVFFRSLATRTGDTVPAALADAILAARAWGADLVIVETPGIGQGDSAIVPFVDVPVYVMTPEFGASSQLEKIDMLDFADVVVINKFERRGAQDALRDVRRQYARNREAFHVDPETLPVFGTVASRFNDDGVTALYQHITALLADHGLELAPGSLAPVSSRVSTTRGGIVPSARQRYLSEITDAIRRYHAATETQAASPVAASSWRRRPICSPLAGWRPTRSPASATRQRPNWTRRSPRPSTRGRTGSQR